jgi:ubiquinone/menaquinone biosynthesis C-methylase UbiE
MENNSRGRKFGGSGGKFGPKKFGGPRKFGGKPSFGAARGPRKFGGPRPKDGEAPAGRVGGNWRASGVESPAGATRRRGDFRPPHLRDGAERPQFERRDGDRPAPRFSRSGDGATGGYASRPYAARQYGTRGPRSFSSPRPEWNRDGAAERPRREFAPRPHGDRSAGRSFDRPDFRRDERPTRAPAKTSWGVSAEWYDGAVEADGSYQKDLILPALTRLLAIKGDERVADIACGQGFFARSFAGLGASVEGVDISPELVAIAKERGGEMAKFRVAPAHETGLPDGDFDHATVVLALQNIRELAETLAESARVLKRGGALHIVLNHPCFRVPKKSSWGYDEAADTQFRRVDAYLSDAAVRMEMHPGAAPEVATASFHRPLQAYFKALEKAGFAVTRLEEWSSNKTSQPGKRAEAENTARREFPLFMYIRAEKR